MVLSIITYVIAVSAPSLRYGLDTTATELEEICSKCSSKDLLDGHWKDNWDAVDHLQVMMMMMRMITLDSALLSSQAQRAPWILSTWDLILYPPVFIFMIKFDTPLLAILPLPCPILMTLKRGILETLF